MFSKLFSRPADPPVSALVPSSAAADLTQLADRLSLVGCAQPIEEQLRRNARAPADDQGSIEHLEALARSILGRSEELEQEIRTRFELLPLWFTEQLHHRRIRQLLKSVGNSDDLSRFEEAWVTLQAAMVEEVGRVRQAIDQLQQELAREGLPDDPEPLSLEEHLIRLRAQRDMQSMGLVGAATAQIEALSGLSLTRSGLRPSRKWNSADPPSVALLLSRVDDLRRARKESDQHA